MLTSLIVALCVLLRLVPHPANFVPIGALAIFSGRTLKPRTAFLLVIVAMVLGDMALALTQGYALFDKVTPFVYAGYLLQVLLGRGLRQRRGGAIMAALLGSTGFFVLSNLGVWAFSGMYPLSAGGFAACFVAALPFLAGTVAGDLVWTVALVLLYRPLAARFKDGSAWVPVPLRELATV